MFVSTFVLVHTSDGEHLEWAPEVENLLVHNDPDAPTLHESLHSSLVDRDVRRSP